MGTSLAEQTALPVYFLISHPIQYYSPLFKAMTLEQVDLEVWYCSDETLKEHHDKQFNTRFVWDIPLLEGYKYIFIPNHSWKASIYTGFFGLLNLSVIAMLIKKPKGILIVHGWHRATMLLAIIFGRLLGHTVCLRSDNPVSHEFSKSAKNRTLKKIFLKPVFALCNYILYVGQQNKKFYQYYGVSESKLKYTAYGVDNDRFRDQYEQLKSQKDLLKQKRNIQPQDKVILFCGKYISKKAPMDLLKAYKECNTTAWLIMVGEGELRAVMEAYILEQSLTKVLLTGFVNQIAIAEYYAMADVLVLPSDHGETWGLVINEGMNFNLPVIVSDRVGCGEDLVEDGVNGFIYPHGNIKVLAACIHQVIQAPENRMGEQSGNKIQMHTYQKFIKTIKSIARKSTGNSDSNQ